MKKLILVVIVFAGLLAVRAQPIQVKPNQPTKLKIPSGGFCTVVDGKWVTLTLGTNSVIFDDQFAEHHYKQAFLIVQQKEQDNFLFFNIILPDKAKAKIKTSYREGLYILKLPKQNEQDSISIYHDKNVLDLKGNLSLSTIAKLKQQFYETWYPEARFRSFANFRDCHYASKEELQSMSDAWTNKFNLERSKISANTDWQLEREEIAQNIWTSILIRFHFNPVVNFTVLHQYFMSNKVPMPLLADYDGPVIYIDQAFVKPQ